jgi:hypothetical protein
MSFLIKKPVIKKKKYLEMIGKIPVYGQGRPISSLLITFTPSEERTETKRKSKVIYRAISKIDSKMGKGLILTMD